MKMKCSKNLTIDSEPSVLCRLREWQEFFYTKGRVDVIRENFCLILYLFPDSSLGELHRLSEPRTIM